MRVIPVVFNSFAFAFCEAFEGTRECDAFAGRGTSEENVGRRSEMTIIMKYLMNSESAIVSISMELQEKTMIFKGGPQGTELSRPDQGRRAIKEKTRYTVG